MASKTKRELSPAEIDDQIVGNQPIREWEKHFSPVKKGFNGDLSFTNHRVGVLIIRHHGSVVYVGSGTAGGQGMLARLRQLAFTNSTGGHHWGAQKIRENIDSADLSLLLFERGEMSRKDIQIIAYLIKKKYYSEWAAPEAVIKSRISESYSKRSSVKKGGA